MAEIARNADPTATQLLQRAGFLILADINGDGRNDYILETAKTAAPSGAPSRAAPCASRLHRQGDARNEVTSRRRRPRASRASRGRVASPRRAGAPGTIGGAGRGHHARLDRGGGGRREGGAADLRGETAPSRSLTSHCNTVNLRINSNGGFVTEAPMGDATLALNEQFCLARPCAIAEGEKPSEGVSAGPAQIAARCLRSARRWRPTWWATI